MIETRHDYGIPASEYFKAGFFFYAGGACFCTVFFVALTLIGTVL